MKQKAFFKYKISKILDEIILIIVAIMFLFPLLWMLCASFYDTTQASQYPPRLFPDPISLRSYLYVFSDKMCIRDRALYGEPKMYDTENMVMQATNNEKFKAAFQLLGDLHKDRCV